MPACFYHQDRPGVGVCMRCRKVICTVCCTRVDGVNHCHACLKALGSKPEVTRPARNVWPVVGAMLLAGGVFLLAGLCWLVQGTFSP